LRPHELDASIRQAFQPRAVTLVGASPKSFATQQLLRNLTREDLQFPGPIQLVNPKYREINGLRCRESVTDYSEPGLVILLVSAEECLNVLGRLTGLPDGVIVFSAGFRDVGNLRAEGAVKDWADRHGVAVFGPQSIGLLAVGSRLMAIAAPVPELVVPGSVGLLSQSGGLLGSLLRGCYRADIGISKAASYGNGASLGFLELSREFLLDDGVGILAAYVESGWSVPEIRAIGELASQIGKPVVFTLPVGSESAQRAAASHTGGIATPPKVIEGVARQFGLVAVRDLDEMIQAVKSLAEMGRHLPSGAGIAVTSLSGGASTLFADAISRRGLQLSAPEAATKARLAERGYDVQENPIDLGADIISNQEKYRDLVDALASDPTYGILVSLAGLGLPDRRLEHHFRLSRIFAEVAQKHHKIPFFAAPIVEDLRRGEMSGCISGAGFANAAVMLAAISAWIGNRLDEQAARVTAAEQPGPSRDEVGVALNWQAPANIVGGSVISGVHAQQLLSTIPIEWPRAITVESVDQLLQHLADVPLPAMVKVEGLPHRSVVGGIAGGLVTAENVYAAVDYLLQRFRKPVSVVEWLDHAQEYGLGFELNPEHGPLIMFGRGGVGIGDAVDFRSLPVTPVQSRRLADMYQLSAPQSAALYRLIESLHRLIVSAPWIEAIDLNPILISEASTVIALDAKVFPSRQAAIDGQPEVGSTAVASLGARREINVGHVDSG
jgi:acyl-CoA synthetase (NDP forming)